MANYNDTRDELMSKCYLDKSQLGQSTCSVMYSIINTLTFCHIIYSSVSSELQIYELVRMERCHWKTHHNSQHLSMLIRK